MARLSEKEVEAMRAKLPKASELTCLDLLYPSRYLKACDLKGREVTTTILAVELDVLQTVDGSAKVKPLLTLSGTDKLFVCVKTNGRTIADLYGDDPRAWVGKRITLYAAHNVSSPRGLTDALRIRDKAPPPAKGAAPSQPHGRQSGED